jgi:non-homologous end joining protein Ku
LHDPVNQSVVCPNTGIDVQRRRQIKTYLEIDICFFEDDKIYNSRLKTIKTNEFAKLKTILGISKKERARK